MKQALYNIAYLLGAIGSKLWRIAKGVFIYIINLSKVKDSEDKLDRKLFFRKETKKQMARWVTEERKFINQQRKKEWIPKNLKKNDAFYNYLFSVVMNIDPHDTPEEIVQKFYDFTHPFLIQYYHVAMHCKKLPASGSGQIEHLRHITRDIPDIFARAKRIAEIKKSITQKVRELDKSMRINEDLKNKQLDAMMVKENIKLLEESISQRKEKVDRMNKILEGETSKIDHAKKNLDKSMKKKKATKKKPTKE